MAKMTPLGGGVHKTYVDNLVTIVQNQINTLAAGSNTSVDSLTAYTCATTVSAGDVVYVSAADTVAKANAAAAATMPAIGVVVSKPSTTSCIVRNEGVISGRVGLVPGATYYASATTPGGLTADPPVTPGTVIQEIGYARNSTTLVVDMSGFYILN